MFSRDSYLNRFQFFVLGLTMLGVSACASLPQANVSKEYRQAALGATLPADKTTAGCLEKKPGLFTTFDPVFQHNNRAWSIYLKRESTLDQQIQDCRKTPEKFPPRFRLWIEMMDSIACMPPDKEMLKITLANLVCHCLVEYDVDKFRQIKSPRNIDPARWYMTPYELLAEHEGKGICSDFAVLTQKTLEVLGYKNSDLRLVAGKMPNGDYHMVLVVKTKSAGEVVLENLPPPGCNPDGEWAFVPVPPDDYLNGGPAGQTAKGQNFTPINSYSHAGIQKLLSNNRNDTSCPGNNTLVLGVDDIRIVDSFLSFLKNYTVGDMLGDMPRPPAKGQGVRGNKGFFCRQ